MGNWVHLAKLDSVCGALPTGWGPWARRVRPLGAKEGHSGIMPETKVEPQHSHLESTTQSVSCSEQSLLSKAIKQGTA